MIVKQFFVMYSFFLEKWKIDLTRFCYACAIAVYISVGNYYTFGKI